MCGEINMTFRVEFFCDDRKLALALRALAGIARGAPAVHPVVNIAGEDEELETENGARPAGLLRAATDGSQLSMLARYLHKKKIRETSTLELRTFLSSIGFAVTRSSPGNLATKARA